MKVLLTGASGQLGLAIQQQLAKTDYTLRVLSHQQLDITDKYAVNQLMAEYQPDIVINCAAYTAVDKAEQQSAQCFAVNTQAAAVLAQLCLQYNSMLIHFSTDYVFDGCLNRPYTEQDIAAPLNVYGKSKLAGEQAIQASGCRYLIIRTGWLFSEFGHNFLRTMQRLAMTQKQIKVVNDQFGGPTSASQLAIAVVQLMNLYRLEKKLPWGLYHYGGQPYVSWYQFAAAILEKLQYTGDVVAINSQHYPAIATRSKNSCLNSQLFCQTFNFAAAEWQPELARIFSADKTHLGQITS